MNLEKSWQYQGEFLLAYEDGTWDTDLFDIPLSVPSSDITKLIDWWVFEHQGKSVYRKVILATPYCVPYDPDLC